MSSDIKVLKEIGLKEVSRKTYIEVKYLQRMVDKDFANLNRANTLGFVKILKREYNLDLSNWAKEFEEYLKENEDEVADEQLFIDTKPNFWHNKTYILLIVVFIVLLGGFLYSYFYNRNSNILPTTTDTIFTQAVENATSADLISDDANDENTTTDNVTEELSDATTNDDVESVITSKKAILKPNGNLWIGLINLNTFGREAFEQSSSFEIDLTKEQLILAGHGFFKVESENGEILDYGSTAKRYLYVKNGTIKEIDRSDFRNLNRGRDW
ncbi:MAG: hypothetical protein LBG67_04140 [Campylobacteraceae bacterium]|jgi:cytoskeletal protein RodZ|nr:hypothetical protein [Campylobacteraceae bacterium]